MEITIENVDQVTVVRISGDIDGKTAPEVQVQISEQMQPGGKILLDMSGVTFMSSAGLRVLLTTYRRATQEKTKVVLAGLNDDIMDTMSATGFLDFFVTCDTVEAGLQELQ